MVYNHLKDKVKSFLQPFAESGQAVGAEDIKAYFEKLRGDAEAIKAAGGAAVDGNGGGGVGEGDNRREQGGKWSALFLGDLIRMLISTRILNMMTFLGSFNKLAYSWN